MILHSFNGPDGEYPHAGLVMGPSGALYGVTTDTDEGYGTAFELDPPTDGGTDWSYTAIYQFTVDDPPNAPVFGPGQSLYGNTYTGENSAGTVYSLTPASPAGGAWTGTTLYNFPGGSGGSGPRGTLAVGKNGTLFGVTEFGGRVSKSCHTGCGTVFALTPPAVSGGPWTNTVLYAFNPLIGDGINPDYGVVLGPTGVLYGSTSGGSGCPCGTIFSLTPAPEPGEPMTETILHSFTSPDGSGPSSIPVLGPNGVLYGTTEFAGPNGGGVVFELAPPVSPGGSWTETILYSFTGGADGFDPIGLTLGADGSLYGITAAGGAFNHETVFSVTP